MPLAMLLPMVLTATPVEADEPNLGEVVLETKGYIVPASQVTVSPKVSGQVVELLIEEGKRVKAGEVLARFDPTEYDAALRIARAELKLAEAGLSKAKESSGKADLAIAQAKVEMAQVHVALAQSHLDSTVIRSPINGTVMTKRAEVGTPINPKSIQGTTSLCDIADLRTVDIEIWIPERDLNQISVGQRCRIQLDAFPQTAYRGSVSRLLPMADRARGAVGVRIRMEVPEKDSAIRPEMSALVTIGKK
jgi:RND family efflux transporter MFP subunit